MSRALATWLPQALGSPFCVLWLCSSLCKLGQKAPLGSRLLWKSTHWGEVATDGAVAEGTLCHPCRRALARCPSCQHGHRCRTCAAARSPWLLVPTSQTCSTSPAFSSALSLPGPPLWDIKPAHVPVQRALTTLLSPWCLAQSSRTCWSRDLLKLLEGAHWAGRVGKAVTA